MELEEEFDINIPDDAAEKIQTVGQAVDHISAAVDGLAKRNRPRRTSMKTRRHYRLGADPSCKVDDL